VNQFQDADLHHGDRDVSSLLHDHGLVRGLQLGHRQTPEGQVGAGGRGRGAPGQPLQPLHILRLHRLLL